MYNIMTMKKYFVYSVLTLSLIAPAFVSAQTTDQDALIKQLEKQVEELTIQIHTLQQQLGVVQGELGAPGSVPAPTSGASSPKATQETIPPEFSHTLARGSSGDDVRKLQEFLATDKEIYPEGLITAYFGPLTEAAVKRWQAKYDIESVGAVGPKTIAKFKELGEQAGTTQTTPALPTQQTGQNATVTRPTTSTQPVTTQQSSQPPISTQPTTATAPSGSNFTSTSATTNTTTTTTATTTTSSGSSATTGTPVISGIQVTTLTSTEATLVWTTDISSNSQASYDTVNNSILHYWVGDNNRCDAGGYVTAHCIHLTGLTAGTPYYYTVLSLTAGGLSTESSHDKFVTASSSTTATTTSTADITPPSTPVGLSATVVSSSQIDLSWTASSDNVGVASYWIYRDGTFWSQTSYLSVAVTGLNSNTTYGFYIKAADAAGNASPASATVSATTQTSSTGTCSDLTFGFQNNKTTYAVGESGYVTYACSSSVYVCMRIINPAGAVTNIGCHTATSGIDGFSTGSYSPGVYTARACYGATGYTDCPTVAASAQFTVVAPSCTSLTIALNKTTYNIGDTVSATYTCPMGTTANIYDNLLWPNGGFSSHGPYVASPQATANYYLESVYALGTYTLRGCFDINCQTVGGSVQFTLATASTTSSAATKNKFASILYALEETLQKIKALLNQLKQR